MKNASSKLSVLVSASLLSVGVAWGLSSTFFQSSTVTQASEVDVAPTSFVRQARVQSDGADLFALNRHLIAIADTVRPTVVNISVTKTGAEHSPFFNSPFFDDPFFRRFFGERFREERRQPPKPRQQGMGSGVIISTDGYIVTNYHVVKAGDTIQVALGDERSFEAELIGTDSATDLAVVKIEASDLPFLSWGDSGTLQVGEMVVAVGNPFGLNQTVTMGIISAVGRANVGIVDYEDFIQTDAAINPGNSGGALVNLRGELIGINTAIFSRSGGYMGIGFAIPSNMVKTVTRHLKTHGKMVRGWLGVSIQNLTPELAGQFDVPDTKGSLVTDVIEASPAHGRLRRGDIIRRYGGRPVENSTRLRAAVADTPPGTEIAIGIVREGREHSLPVVIQQMSGERAGLDTGVTGGERHALSGVTVEPVRPGRSARATGVRVARVDPDSRAAKAGLRADDHILEINRIKLEDVEDFDRVTGQLAEDDSVLLLLRRGNAVLFFSVGKP